MQAAIVLLHDLPGQTGSNPRPAFLQRQDRESAFAVDHSDMANPRSRVHDGPPRATWLGELVAFVVFLLTGKHR